MAGSLATLLPARPQKVENVPDELGNQAEISRPSIDSWLLFVAYTTKQERDKLKEGLLNNKKECINN